MADQLDMFGSVEPAVPEDVGTLIDDMVASEQKRPQTTGSRPHMSPAVFDIVVRFLAGMVYRDAAPTFERLTAVQRQTAERAAHAALDEFAKED